MLVHTYVPFLWTKRVLGHTYEVFLRKIIGWFIPAPFFLIKRCMLGHTFVFHGKMICCFVNIITFFQKSTISVHNHASLCLCVVYAKIRAAHFCLFIFLDPKPRTLWPKPRSRLCLATGKQRVPKLGRRHAAQRYTCPTAQAVGIYMYMCVSI